MSVARKGIGIVSVNWLILPLYLVTSIIIVRWLGVEGRGIVVVLSSAAAFLSGIGHFGIPAAGIYYARNGVIGERTIFFYFLGFVLFFFFVCIVALLLFEDLFVRAFLDRVSVNHEWMIVMLMAVPFMMLNNYLATILLAKGDARGYAGMQVGIGCADVLGTLILVVWLGLGITGAMYSILLAQGIACLVRTTRMFKTTRGQPVVMNGDVLEKILCFGAKHYLGTIGAQIFKRANNFLLAFFLDTRAVGYYSVAMIPYEAALSIPRGVNAFLSGNASALNPRDAAFSVAESFRKLLWVMILVAAGLAVVSPFVLPLMYGGDFVRSNPALLILLVVSVLLGCAMNLQTYFLGTGKPGINGVLTLITGLMNLVLAVFLIPLWGIEGNAVSALLAWLVGLYLYTAYFLKESRLSLATMCILRKKDVVGFMRLAGEFLQDARRYFGRRGHDHI
ncbi:MAG: hypothetical protein A2283_11975 [Lentisphaerae bacterium RIFOXYA12_FULL_48_11]|nr:MAG: hypothetical protein A2283_11975 [Lentisphaerae bacterium RIFOXYA12_FULL_48_11]